MVFNLPKSTEIRKPVYKKLIYDKFATELSGNKKEQFDSDISRIIITNEISETSVNVKPTEDVSSIFVVQIEMRFIDYNDRSIILVSKLFGQKLLMVLHYDEKYQLAIYETKLLKSEWKNEKDINLDLSGLDMKSVWENLVSQVSGIHAVEGKSLQEQISIEADKEKILKQIEKLERMARKEPQSKRKFELHQIIKEYQKKLEDM